MKSFAIVLTAIALGLGTPAFAGAGKVRKAGGGKHGLAIRKLDQDGNHKMEGEEIVALKSAFAKAPADSKMRKRLDANGNGLLDDNEIAALNAHLAKHADKAAGQHARKASGKKRGKAA
jgi:hypothetical protein